MDEKRVKPRFNVIDAIVLIAVIAVAAGVGYRALYKPVVEAITTEKINVTLTVRIRSIHTEVAEALIKELPSPCVSREDTVPGSTVKSAYTEPAAYVAVDSGGTPVVSIDPVRVDLVVTVEGICPKDDAIYLIGNQEARIGRSFIVKTLSVEMTGIVTEINIKGA